MNVRKYNEILEEMKNCAAANNSGLTDFNSGSVIMTIFEAVARPVEQAYIDARNGFVNNLNAIPYSIFDFQQKTGQKASVNVVFTRDTASDHATTIPQGTKVSDGSHVFITTENAVIPINQTASNSVGATAEEVGEVYNVDKDTVQTIESNVSNEISGVNNPNSASGGINAETQLQMLQRFKIMINGLQGCNHYGIKSAVLQLESVRSVGIEEHFPPKNNVYNFTIYIDDGTGGLGADLQNHIFELVNGDDTPEKPGLKAAGTNFDVLAADAVPVDVSFTVYVYRVDHEKIKNTLTDKLQNYINGLGIHSSVVLTSVIVMIKQVTGVQDITNLTLNGGTENININEHSIARFNSATINVYNQ